ncbi:helicase C-terminal domain-containing protein [Chromohalobacter sp. 48-RD10]|uniref:helicase C-terminal domain-containing protein n=2 Tax=unclassified Chromohalobacter TaxID=2628571 RepID=UPI002468AA07|nr:helicase C-terminal domain-containing protein [Chromohalobacter sp. 48-RD10]
MSEAVDYTVAVRTLCDFTAKRGDLDLRFTPSPSAEEGIEGHAWVASRRASHYEFEVALNGVYWSAAGYGLRVRGRADGFDPRRGRLEEIKTHRGDLTRQPDNHRHLHWAQLRLYGWLLCEARGLDELELALVYFDIARQIETPLVERVDRDTLRHFFEAQCAAFLDWALQETAHRTARDEALVALRFPHASWQGEQRTLAENVYKAASTGRSLLAQAPTGTGKTLGTLFPMLKAMPTQRLDGLCYLAAKTPGRQLALNALKPVVETTPLRVLELTARDKACEHPDLACHGESCPLAAGFFDKMPGARRVLIAGGDWDRARLRDVALTHNVCPYYLGQEMARWSDITVGDYHYYFASGGLLHLLAQTNDWRLGVLVDEAHNLVERARDMYSASLDQGDLRALIREKPAGVSAALKQLNREWNALGRECINEHTALEHVPEAWLAALQRLVGTIGQVAAEPPYTLSPALQRFYFDALKTVRIAELFDRHFVCDIAMRPGHRGMRHARLSLRNIVPAPLLTPRFKAAHASVLFSATLTPERYQRDLLGLPEDSVWLDVASPFANEQLSVHIARHISTRFRDREASLAPIADLIAATYARRPGNYLAFFSSFAYLEDVAARLQEAHPEVPQWQQARGMDETARADFLARFTSDGRGVGFAVLGGAFGEGIDLPGERLIGAFIATLGLPQVNPVNEQRRRYLQAMFGAGYDYAYVYPGVQKVIQAAGRVIRSREDRGTIHLIDDRFAEPRIQALLPSWWHVTHNVDVPARTPGGASLG